jgi:hypothetical protein
MTSLVAVRRCAFAGAFALAASIVATPARAYCPSYGSAAGCAVEPIAGKNPSEAALRAFFDKVGAGALAPADGPALLSMTRGCGAPTPKSKGAPRFPCHVLWAIAQQESDWTHFCVPESPSSAVGAPERTIVSFDCGYGIAQVTSGMHSTDDPAFDQTRVASDPLYNMVVGAGILRDKWEAVQCVGDRNPGIVEDWYSALWAYNGLSYTNNPNNPNYSAGRGAYDPQNGGSYPYQERVLGWMEHPPKGAQGFRWPAISPAYPNRGEIGTSGSPKALSEPACESPTRCTSKRTTHESACSSPAVPSDGGPPPPPPPPPSPPDDAGEIAVSAEVEAEEESGCACSDAGRGRSSSSSREATAGAFGLVVAGAVRRRRRAR